jgi:anthraniloyl-CoA monooxygenase
MKIGVIGGGPAGLFFARLMKMRRPTDTIDIFEQNPRGATYGFGVTLTDSALRPIAEHDPELVTDFLQTAVRQDHITVHHRKELVRVDGNVFYGIARVALLEMMQRHCEEVGVGLHFESRIATLADMSGYDLVVGADGINSAIRDSLAGHFSAVKEPRQNLWAWYATDNRVEGINLIFEQTKYGVFIGHTYRYAEDRSGFVVECDPETWRRAKLDKMSDDESLRFCEAIFAEHLNGHALLSNRSSWFRPAFVTSQQWHYKNLVLIGDALKTVHPSLGSGTRVGMQDAIALVQALDQYGDDLPTAFAEYVTARRPLADAFQDAAMRSIVWYEAVNDKLHLAPVDFAFSFMMRTGRVNYQRLRTMDRAYVDAYERAPSAFLNPARSSFKEAANG